MTTALRIILSLSCLLLASVAEERACSAPPEFPDAKLVRYSGEKAIFKCADGYEPYNGRTFILCVDGQWSNLTLQCQKKLCGSAGELLNGFFKYEGDAVFGDKAYAMCEEGYKLNGPKYIVCESAGWSKESPTCEEGEVTCSHPKVANSQKRDGFLVYRMNDVINVTCSHGFQLVGAEQVTCGRDGQWQPQPPQCVPTPEKTGRCGVPTHTGDSHAYLAHKYSSLKSFPSGSMVYYVCEVGYSHAGGRRYRRCIKGNWSPLQLRCRRKVCGSAGEISNGQFTYSGVEFGDTATAMCDEGFQLVGRATRNCMSKGWDGRVPVCEAVACGQPPEVAYAELNSYVEPPYQYRTVVQYRCLVGTRRRPAEIWCTQNGTWSSLPQCEDVTCPSPNVPNAYWVASRTGRYQYRDSVYIQCNAHFTIVGQSTITCGSDGQWTPELPKCKSTWPASRRG